VGSGLSGLPRDYLAALHAEIERYKVYPLTARRRGWEGEVRVRFLVERDGTVSDVEILSSSGFSVLDEAAAATLQRIRRLPPLPSTLRLSRLRLELPMVYRLTR
jgi:protein TonB